MFYLKIIESYRKVVCLCDTELLGKKFEEGKFQLEVKENFYKSEKEYSEEEVIEMLQDMKKEDSTFNIVGEGSVKASLKAGVIAEEGIGNIQGIPFALVLL